MFILGRMMRNYIAIIMLFTLVLPAFVSFAPHDALHAMHSASTSHPHANHHRDEHAGHQHHHDKHDHGEGEVAANAHHPIVVDVVSYYADFLHIDLRHVDADALAIVSAPNSDQGSDYDMGAGVTVQDRYELASVRLRAPPERSLHQPDGPSLYLTTLRLRI